MLLVKLYSHEEFRENVLKMIYFVFDVIYLKNHIS